MTNPTVEKLDVSYTLFKTRGAVAEPLPILKEFPMAEDIIPSIIQAKKDHLTDHGENANTLYLGYDERVRLMDDSDFVKRVHRPDELNPFRDMVVAGMKIIFVNEKSHLNVSKIGDKHAA